MTRTRKATDAIRRNSGEHGSRPAPRRVARLAVAIALSTGLPALLAVFGAAAAHSGGVGSALPPPGEAARKASGERPAAPAGDAPILEGILEPRQIIDLGPEWRESLLTYAPDPEVVGKIRAITSKRRSELKVEVVVGTWCGDSRREVPRFIKVQQDLGEDRLPATYVGVDRSKQEPAELVQGRDIQRVPTFIVYHEGREIGRIIEKPEISVEADLERILAKLQES